MNSIELAPSPKEDTRKTNQMIHIISGLKNKRNASALVLLGVKFQMIASERHLVDPSLRCFSPVCVCPCTVLGMESPWRVWINSRVNSRQVD